MTNKYWGIGKELFLEPVIGNRRYVKFNRTHYDISLKGEGSPAVNGLHWVLPELSSEGSLYQIDLDEKGRFHIKVAKGAPFLINGISSFWSIPREGDIVWLGQNRLSLREEGKLEEDHPFLSHALLESDLPILIEGETGTGKSYLAKEIHGQSGRIGEFVQVNLASFSSGLIESELFGHVKGAFTGALKEKRGAIQMAKGGTLFLDELDSLSLELQTKLLIFLDHQEFRPVGAEREQKGDVRLIFASGKKLSELVSKGEFRKDLFYRISCGKYIELPSLRQNQEKLLQLIHSYMLHHRLGISPRLKEYYLGLKWPGNVRQLYSHLNKKRVLESSDYIDYSVLDEELLGAPTPSIIDEDEITPLEEIRMQYCQKVFNQLDRNLVHSAKQLKISPNTLRRILAKTA